MDYTENLKVLTPGLPNLSHDVAVKSVILRLADANNYCQKLVRPCTSKSFQCYIKQINLINIVYVSDV